MLEAYLNRVRSPRFNRKAQILGHESNDAELDRVVALRKGPKLEVPQTVGEYTSIQATQDDLGAGNGIPSHRVNTPNDVTAGNWFEGRNPGRERVRWWRTLRLNCKAPTQEREQKGVRMPSSWTKHTRFVEQGIRRPPNAELTGARPAWKFAFGARPYTCTELGREHE